MRKKFQQYRFLFENVLDNQTIIEGAGCFFDTYNPCEDVSQLSANKWSCQYCEHEDGCNSAQKIRLINKWQLTGITAVTLFVRIFNQI